MSDEIVTHSIIREEGDWLYGVTSRTNHPDIHWMKLTESAYNRVFWFLDDPTVLFKKRFGFDIPAIKANAIHNLFESNWTDFLYFVASIDGEKTFDLAVNLIIGPIAEYCKEKNVNAFSVIKEVNLTHILQIFTSTSNLNYKSCMIDVLHGMDLSEAVRKHTLVTIDFDTLFEDIIARNPDQFEKCLKNDKLDNWFVGQAIKLSSEKINPQEALISFRKLKSRLTAQ